MAKRSGPALLTVMKPNKEVIHPEDYLTAAGELLFLLFVAVWGVTYFVTPQVIHSNPLKDRLGYNNLCVGFDMHPATYVGLVLFMPCVYLCIRYVWTDMERSVLNRALLTTTQFRFSVATDILYGLSICVFGLVFVVTPASSFSVWGHSLAFLQLIFFRFLAVWGNVYEHPAPTRGTVRFMWVYGAVSVIFPALVIANYVAFDLGQQGDAAPFIPSWVTMTFDYTWFLCLALTTKFMPRGEGLRVVTSLAPAEALS